MHILIIPSEEFVPGDRPMLGIFQFDQAKILHAAGYKVGVVSVSLEYSLPMLVKALLSRSVFRKRNNKTDALSFFQLLKLMLRKLLLRGSFVVHDRSFEFPVYRVEGFYLLPPNQNSDWQWWVDAGMRAVKKYIKDNGRPDVVHAHMAVSAGILAEKIKKKTQVPFWMIEHSSLFARGLYHPSLLPMANHAYKNADKVFTVSNFLGHGLKEIFSNFSYELLPNTVDPVIETKSLAETKYQEFTILTIGSLIPLKRHSLLVEAFHKAFGAEERVRLHIIGEGEERHNLIAQISKLNEQGRIKLMGQLSKEEILAELDCAHVLCHQSDYETFGVAVLEALFRGLPVVSTRCGGPEEVVPEFAGIFVAKDHVGELSSALQKVRSEYDAYCAQTIRRYAIEHYGANAFLKRVETHLRKLPQPVAYQTA